MYTWFFNVDSFTSYKDKIKRSSNDENGALLLSMMKKARDYFVVNQDQSPPVEEGCTSSYGSPKEIKPKKTNHEEKEEKEVDFSIVLLLTGEYCELATNLIPSLPYLIEDLKQKLIAVTLDTEAEKCMQTLGITTKFYALNSTSNGGEENNLQTFQDGNMLRRNHSRKAYNLDFRSNGWIDIVSLKVNVIKDILQETQKPILYVDTDVVFLENSFSGILQYFQSLSAKSQEIDIVLPSDSKSYVDHIDSNLCSGVMLLNYTPLTLALMYRTIELLKEIPFEGHQKAINQAINEFQLMHSLQLGTFDLQKFPNGYLYFKHIFKN